MPSHIITGEIAKEDCYAAALKDFKGLVKFQRIISSYLNNEDVLKWHRNVIEGVWRHTDIDLIGYENTLRKLTPLLQSIENAPEMPPETKRKVIRDKVNKLIDEVADKNIRLGIEALDNCLQGKVDFYTSYYSDLAIKLEEKAGRK